LFTNFLLQTKKESGTGINGSDRINKFAEIQQQQRQQTTTTTAMLNDRNVQKGIQEGRAILDKSIQYSRPFRTFI